MLIVGSYLTLVGCKNITSGILTAENNLNKLRELILFLENV